MEPELVEKWDRLLNLVGWSTAFSLIAAVGVTLLVIFNFWDHPDV